MQRTTSPLRMKAILRNLEARKQLADTDTQEIPIVRIRPALLPRDQQGRPYVSVVDEKGYTLELVQAAVKRFIEVQQCAPVVILLSAWRWLEFGRQMGFYYPCSGRPIPYVYEPLAGSYDVLVRGEQEHTFDGN